MSVFFADIGCLQPSGAWGAQGRVVDIRLMLDALGVGGARMCHI